MTKYDPKALLSMPVEDIKEPARMPLGTYIAQGTDYEFDKTKPKDTKKEPTDTVKLAFRIVEPFPDVNAEELAAFMEGRVEKNLHEIEQRARDFFLTPAALFRLKDFLGKDCAIEMPNLEEGLETYKAGARFGVEVGTVPNQREPEKPYHQVVKTFALPEGT